MHACLRAFRGHISVQLQVRRSGEMPTCAETSGCDRGGRAPRSCRPARHCAAWQAWQPQPQAEAAEFLALACNPKFCSAWGGVLLPSSPVLECTTQSSVPACATSNAVQTLNARRPEPEALQTLSFPKPIHRSVLKHKIGAGSGLTKEGQQGAT